MLKKIIGKKKILMLILGIIVGILISVVGVYAATLVNSQDVTYDNSQSKLVSTNVQDALDELYNRVNMPLSSYIVSLYAKSNNKKDVTIGTSTLGTETVTQAKDVNLMQDSHGNIRYYGKNPNNYIKFNNELWRIISISDNRLKIINTKIIPGNLPFDSNSPFTNDWTKTSLRKYLNNDYYNSLNDEAKEMIYKNSFWSLGGISNNKSHQSYFGNLYAINWYNIERFTTVYTGNPYSTIDKIGLMYVSDYMYATDLSICNKVGYNENGDDYRIDNCKNNNWLYTGEYTWTMTPNSTYSTIFFTTTPAGNIYTYETYLPGLLIYPVSYLKTDITLISGDGSNNNPYQIKLS